MTLSGFIAAYAKLTGPTRLHHATVMQRRIEWRLLLGLSVPICTLIVIAALTALHGKTQHLLERHVQTQLLDIARTLDNSTQWPDEQAFRAEVQDWPWREIWIEDSQGAHIWHQTRAAIETRWPEPQRQTLPLMGGNNLVIEPLTLPAAQQHALLRLALITLLAACLGSAIVSWLIYRWVSERWVALARWSLELDAGELGKPPPHTSGLSGHIASLQAVLAQRLRYARDTLAEYTQPPQQDDGERVEQLHQELDATRAQLAESRDRLARRAEFLSAMSHELRTPLTSIVGFAELLEQGHLANESLNYVQTIRKSAAGMVSLVNDFLDMERADAGQLDIHQVGLDLADIVEDTVSLMAPLAYEKNLELVSIVDHDIPARLIGDPGRVQQILTNLVSNAVKFTDHGEVVVRATRVSDDNGALRIRLKVQDSGPGLSQAQQDQLFTAYQRFEQDGQHVVAGSGLGLNIVRKLTDLLGGDIQVDSQPGHGASFSVTLPFQPHPQKSMRMSWDGLRGTQLWLVERHPASWRALQHQLEFWSVRSRQFDSPGALQRALENDHADIVLLSLQNDELNEDMLRDMIAASPSPVGVMINSVDARVHRQLQDWGAALVLPKSATRTTLYRALSDLRHLREGDDSNALTDQHVLIAENNPASQYFLKALLENLGARVTLANNGREALELWRAQRQPYVLLDLNMPELDGQQATHAIRDEDPGAAAVIIGMSAYLTPEQEREWLNAGLNDLLTKPFDQAQLLRCLHPWLHAEKPVSQPAKRGTSAKLVHDPELAAMMQDELPKQLEELDVAFIESDLESARAAAHQLHGTAAFFHLEPLKSHVFLLEKRLNALDTLADAGALREDMAAVTAAVRNVLDGLRSAP
ncbi:MAG: response regulator [Oceanococcus sp.]|nr:MAG: response regulator [Oceanococcus sp.]